MPTHRDDDEEERILESYRRDDDEVMELLDEASRRREGDDAFRLHFPVPKDRTMRRLAISQLILLVVAPVSCVGSYIVDRMDTAKPLSLGAKDRLDLTNPYDVTSTLLALITLLSLFLLFIIIPITYSSIMTRRYGWRAMQDPIEAQRVAVREGLADVLTAKSQPEAEQRIASLATANPRLRPINTRR